MLYEMLTGRPPFMSNDPYELFQKSVEEKIKFPKDFDSKAKSLIKKLTKKDLSERFGNLLKGANDVKDHRFFRDFNWDQVLQCDPKNAPYVPEVKPYTKDKVYSINYLPEGLDEIKYPPMIPANDPFLKFF